MNHWADNRQTQDPFYTFIEPPVWMYVSMCFPVFVSHYDHCLLFVMQTGMPYMICCATVCVSVYVYSQENRG